MSASFFSIKKKLICLHSFSCEIGGMQYNISMLLTRKLFICPSFVREFCPYFVCGIFISLFCPYLVRVVYESFMTYISFLSLLVRVSCERFFFLVFIFLLEMLLLLFFFKAMLSLLRVTDILFLLQGHFHDY